MKKFELILKTEVTGEHSGYSINEYKYSHSDSKEDIINSFLTAENFKQEDFSSLVKLVPNKEYLGHALNLENIKISDFKKYEKQKLIIFLDEIINKSSINEVILTERYLLGKLIQSINFSNGTEFYVVSRDFFDLTYKHGEMLDKRIEFAMTVYNPYILILWTSGNILNVCQYASD